MEDFKERLQIIFDEYGLSASEFADKVGIQRSSISHIVSGRNNPSLDFMVKTRDAFPELNWNWLIEGLEPMKSKIVSKPKPKVQKPVKPEIIEETTPLPDTSTDAVNLEIENEEGSEIKNIVVFYKNGSFKEFKAV